MKPNNSKQSEINDTRPNQRWVAELRGDSGPTAQRDVHHDLYAYLFVTALNHLRIKQSQNRRLAQYCPEELGKHAEDFVQQFMLKLVQDDYHLLTKYEGHGRFLAWAAQILRNLIGSEFRKREWRLSERLADNEHTMQMQPITQWDCCPTTVSQHNQIAGLLADLLDHVSPRNRIVFLRYVVDGERACVVADALDMSVASVYSVAHRMRAMARRALTKADYF